MKLQAKLYLLAIILKVNLKKNCSINCIKYFLYSNEPRQSLKYTIFYFTYYILDTLYTPCSSFF